MAYDKQSLVTHVTFSCDDYHATPAATRLRAPIAVSSASMHLPIDLSEAVERELANTSAPALAKAAAQLSASYTAGHFTGALATPELRAAYLAVRLPATYAADVHVFSELRRVAADLAPRSLLDLGSGPGTAAWAATAVFPSLERLTCLEGDTRLIEAGKRLVLDADHGALRSVAWARADLNSHFEAPAHDLVTLTYVVGELGSAAAHKLLERAWSLTKEALIIVEPGTPKAFGRVAELRRALIALGAHLAAPCPHHNECPMAAAGDWCHFAQRLERTSVHRRLKQGSLGFEDEKFSYIVATKRSIGHASARIVRHPAKNPGHVQLTLCTPEGIQKRTIGKSQKDSYKVARHSDWGDSWGATGTKVD